MLTFLALVLVGILAGCNGYKAGAPLEVCGDMTPKHDAPAQTSNPPYNITISASSYKSGDKVMVTVTSLEPIERFFEGVFLQARKTGSNLPIGTFSFASPDAGMKTIKCAGGKYDNNAVTHTDETKRTSKSVMWTSEDGEDVVFQATFVNHKATFWTNVRSAELMGDGVNSASGHAHNVLLLFGLIAIAIILRSL